MRLSIVLFAFAVVGSATAQMSALSTAIGSVASLGKTALGFLPAAGAASAAVPLLIGLKGLAIIKGKKFLLLKAPLIAPIALAKAKYGIVKFKLGLAKSAFRAAGQTTANMIELPLKMTAVKMGALSGAIAGAKGGLASYRTHPRKSLFKQFAIPHGSLLSGIESRIPNIPMKEIHVNINSAAPAPEPVPEAHVGAPAYGGKPEPAEVEIDAPAYGSKPVPTTTSTTTTTTTTTTPRPPPSYVPEPVQPSY